MFVVDDDPVLAEDRPRFFVVESDSGFFEDSHRVMVDEVELFLGPQVVGRDLHERLDRFW